MLTRSYVESSHSSPFVSKDLKNNILKSSLSACRLHAYTTIHTNMWHELRECLRARCFRATLILNPICVRSWCNWRASCVDSKTKQKKERELKSWSKQTSPPTGGASLFFCFNFEEAGGRGPSLKPPTGCDIFMGGVRSPAVPPLETKTCWKRMPPWGQGGEGAAIELFSNIPWWSPFTNLRTNQGYILFWGLATDFA